MSVDEGLERVSYGTSENPYLRSVTHSSGRGFEDTLASIKAGIERGGFWIVGEIDPQGLARKAGLSIPPARQILFFHPRYLRRLLERCPDALIAVPLKFALLQHHDGRVSLRATDVERAFAPYPELSDLAGELSEGVAEILAGIAGLDPAGD